MEVLGKVIGKGRPRFTRRGSYVTTYTPRDTQKYEEKIKEVYLYQECKKFENDPLKIKITAYYKPPESISQKKKKELIGTWRDKKPDIDNIAKIVCDALNGVAYKDDNQIALMLVAKLYGEEDKLIVEIDELGVQDI